MKEIDKKIQNKKLLALKHSIKSLEKSTKVSGLMYILGDKSELSDSDCIPTGMITLDSAISGFGIPRGKIVEIFGMESSGKSLICQKIIASCQKHGGLCAYVDVEYTFDVSFASKLGVVTKDLVISQPSHLQQAFEVIDALIDAGVDVIILDSIAALVPKEEVEGEVAKQTVGLTARYMSQFLRRITGKLARSGSVLICINQVRQKIGVMWGDPSTTPGGDALKFYSSIRMRVSKSKVGMIKEKIGSEDKVVGMGIRVNVVKNKVAPPFGVAEFKVYFDGRTVDDSDEIADIALEKGFIPRYNAKGELTSNGRQYKWFSEPLFLAKSKAEVAEQLRQFENVKKELLDIIMSGNDESHIIRYDDENNDNEISEDNSDDFNQFEEHEEYDEFDETSHEVNEHEEISRDE